MSNKPDRKMVSFRLPEDLLQELRDRADEDGVPLTELVCRFLKQGLQSTGNDRIATLEAEIKELKQSKQVHFGGVFPTPMYPSLAPAMAAYGDENFQQRILKLEAQMEELATNIRLASLLPTYFAKVENLLEEVKNLHIATQSHSISSQANSDAPTESPLPVGATVQPGGNAQLTVKQNKPPSPSDRSSEVV